MVLCVVFGCSKRSGRDKDVSFFRIPKVITTKGKELEKLSRKRREGFLAAVRRSDLNVQVAYKRGVAGPKMATGSNNFEKL